MVPPTGQATDNVTIPEGKEQKLNPEEKKVWMASSTQFKVLSGLTGGVGLGLLFKSIERSESKLTLVISLLAVPVILYSLGLWNTAENEAVSEKRREGAVIAVAKLKELNTKISKFFDEMPESENISINDYDKRTFLRKFDNILDTEKNSENFKYFDIFIQEIKKWTKDLPKPCTIPQDRIQKLPDDLAKCCIERKLSPEFIKNRVASELQAITTCVQIDPDGDWGGYYGNDDLFADTIFFPRVTKPII